MTIVASSVSGLPRQLLVIGGAQPLLDRVPRGTVQGLEVTDLDRQPCLVGQALHLDFPQTRTIAVGATADCGDRKPGGFSLCLSRPVSGEDVGVCRTVTFLASVALH